MGRFFIDLIFGHGHGQLPIDESSFEGSREAEVLGVKTCLIPIEEMIVSALNVAGRRRYDAPDVLHLVKAERGRLDWQRILNRLGDDQELLLWHLILFDFIYPGHSDYLPQSLMVKLFNQVRKRWAAPPEGRRAFRGTLLDPFSYAVDVDDWGYEDRRNLKSLVNAKGDVL
jgi:hypothetical protein